MDTKILIDGFLRTQENFPNLLNDWLSLDNYLFDKTVEALKALKKEE